MEDLEKIKKLLGGTSPQAFEGGSARYTGYCGVCNEKIDGFSDVSIEEARKDCLKKLTKHVEEQHVSGKEWMEEFEGLVGVLENKKLKNIFERVREEKK